MKARGRGSEASQALGGHAEIRTSLGQDSDAATGPSQARVRALGRAGREVALSPFAPSGVPSDSPETPWRRHRAGQG